MGRQPRRGKLRVENGKPFPIISDEPASWTTRIHCGRRLFDTADDSSLCCEGPTRAG